MISVGQTSTAKDMKGSLSLGLLAWGLSIAVSTSAVFTVTNPSDSGAGSLREAILNANAAAGADVIEFNLPGPGVQTIAPLTALPEITSPVAINGYSQPGSRANTLTAGEDAVLLIRLDGLKITNGLPVALGFTTGAGGSSVRGLVIVRFSQAITLNEISNVTIAGNWIGMDVDGVARGTTFEGIYVMSFFSPANNIVIGGTTPADRNVISGNRYGIFFSGTTTANSFVRGNFIGTDPSGTLPRGNMFGGVYLFVCANITVGGAAVGDRNVIGAATAAGGTGVTVQGGSGHLIQGNLIGTDVSGQYDLGNISDGIYVTASKTNRIIGNQVVNNRQNGVSLGYTDTTVVEGNLVGTDASLTRPLGNARAGLAITGSTNRIGGLGAGQGNVIQFNGAAGIEVTFAQAVQNEISGNRIYDNGGLGVDLDTAGVTVNDPNDMDTGANGLQNSPVLTSASSAYGSTQVAGTLNSTPLALFRLEFFASPSFDATGNTEGQLYLGSASVMTDGNGDIAFAMDLPRATPTNYLVTATATDAAGNTSEFSSGIPATSGPQAVSLSIAATGSDQATITWPSAATAYQLEASSSLSPTSQWFKVTTGILDLGQVKSLTVTNVGAGNQFFRLKKN